MVFGREDECAAIDELLRNARDGRSGALVITGEAGIGKSELLEYAVALADGAAQDGVAVMKVLSARGYESESEIPFAGLSDLLRPVMELLPELPGPQAGALQSALSLGPPLAGDRFSICAATLGLLAAAASSSPLLVIVDDAHWLDVSSREAILFAARRLNAEGIALMLAARPSGDRGNHYAGLNEITVSGLSEAQVEELCQRLAPGLTDEGRRQIWDDTAGNPLGVRELCERGDIHRDEPVPGVALPQQSRLARAIWGRMEELPERARKALLLVAAAGGEDTDVVLGAAREAGLGLADFAPAEEAGLLTISGRRIDFRHPMLRSVLYESASMVDRSNAHAALATVLAEVPGTAAADGRAWHLASATLPPSEMVSNLLAAAGGRARRRGGNREAAAAYEQAARFAVPALRAQLWIRAARCWQLAGRAGRMGPLLDQALQFTDDPRTRALIRHMSGYLAMWRSLPGEGLRELIEGAREAEAVDPARAASMYTDASIAYFMIGAMDEGAANTRRGYELSAEGDDGTRVAATVQYAGALVITGERAEGARLLAAVRDLLMAAEPLAAAQAVAHAAFFALWLDDFTTAEKLLDRLIVRARSVGALGVLPQTLAMASELAYRTGDWQAARATAEESVTLAMETKSGNLYAPYLLARIDAAQGRTDDARSKIRWVRHAAGQYGAHVMDLYTGHTLGQLALAENDLETAIAELEALRELPVADEVREPAVVPWRFDLIEAYVRAGRAEDAAALLAGVERAAAAVPEGERSVYLSALTWRAHGLVADRDEMEPAFEAALAAHDACEMPFERARTLLCLGERLRRGRKRGGAREPLRRALRIFQQLDAEVWAARARSELAATGETTSKGTGLVAELTPQELQVALTVARGATNSEAAAALFLSQKTIEYHLSNVYRKTGLHSRAELSQLTAAAS